MRHPVLLTGLLLLMPAAAHAQVTIDLRALEALPQGPPGPTAPEPHRAPRPVLRVVPVNPATRSVLSAPTASPVTAPKHEVTGQTMASATAGAPTLSTPSAATPTPAKPTVLTPTVATPTPPVPPTVAAPAPPPATLPTGAPPIALLAPIPPPAAPITAAPPTPAPVSATSGTTATLANTGLSLVFKSAESDLSPSANDAIGALVKGTPVGSTVTFNVVAYAQGVADDPSAARRTSLARGLSVRTALIADGVPSTHIYVRALGSSAGDGPADRVDVTVLGVSGAVASPKSPTSAGATSAGPTSGGSAKP